MAAEGFAPDPDRLRARGRIPCQYLEHRRRRTTDHRCHRRLRRRPLLSQSGEPAPAAADVSRRRRRRHGLGGDPGFSQGPHEHQRDPRHAHADLYRDAVAILSGARPVARSGWVQLPANRAFAPSGNVRAFRLCLSAQSICLHHGRGGGAYVALRRSELSRLQDVGERRRSACGTLCRFS